MKSKRYCPSCGSFGIRRIKRTFLQKKVLRLSPKYHCIQCHEITHRKYLEQNKLAFQPSLNEIILENAAHSTHATSTHVNRTRVKNTHINSTPIKSTTSNETKTNSKTKSAAIEEISFKDCA